MQHNIIWTGRFYHSIENCLVTNTNSGNEIASTIIGCHENRIFKIDYRIATDEKWETTRVNIRTQLDGSPEHVTLEKQGSKYLLNGEAREDFDHIHEVDITLTPFTNTLPVRRLNLKPKNSR